MPNILLRLKLNFIRYKSKRIRSKLLKKIDECLFSVKGFHVKELFLAQDNRHAIAIDRSGQTLNLLTIENGVVKPCMVQYSDLFAVEMFMRGKSFDKLSRQTGLTQNQQQNLLSNVLTEHLKESFPKSSRVLCLHTSKKSLPLFIIDFHFKHLDSEFEQSKQHQVRNTSSKKHALHWLKNCREIIIKGEEKAVTSRLQNSFAEVEENVEVHLAG